MLTKNSEVCQKCGNVKPKLQQCLCKTKNLKAPTDMGDWQYDNIPHGGK